MKPKLKKVLAMMLLFIVLFSSNGTVVLATEIVDMIEVNNSGVTNEEPAMDFYDKTNDVEVFVHADEGNFPEGTTMKVTAVSTAEVIDTVNNVVDGKIQTVKAVDITFYNREGIEIEPKGYVSVELKAFDINSNEEHHVVHISDNDIAEVVAVADTTSNVAIAEFRADEFSVYVVVGVDGETQAQISTYNFLVGEEIVDTQYIKDGETLVEPAVPELENNEEFLGWYIGENKVDFSSAISVETAETVNVVAKINSNYYITFKEVNGTTNFNVLKVENAGDVDISSISYPPEAAEQAFIGWSLEPNGSVIGNTISVNEDMTLYPIVVEAYWIHFNENDGGTGGGASYTGPIYVEAGRDVSTIEKPEDPTRAGYDFDGWYTDESLTTLYSWSGALDSNITLYAKWTPKTNTKYTIIVKQQSIDDDVNAAQKTYATVSANVYETTTDTVITSSMYSSYIQTYEGFNSPTVEIDEKTAQNENKVRAQGDTVITLLYDRKVITYEFYRAGSTVAPKAQVDTLTGLYGATASVKTPKEAINNSKIYNGQNCWLLCAGDGVEGKEWVGRIFNDLSQFKLFGDKTSTTYRFFADNHTLSRTEYVYYMDLNGEYPTKASYTVERASNAFTFYKNGVEGFTAVEYKTGSNNDKYKNVTENSVTIPESTSNIYIRYSRNQHKIFYNWQDDANTITESSNIYYGASLADYEIEINETKMPSEKVGYYTFGGWCLDSQGTTPFDFNTTLPDENVTLYAKWVPIRYQVTLDTNNDGKGFGESGQIAEFKVDAGEIISRASLEQNVVAPEGYSLIGWYDVETGLPYSYSAVMGDVKLIAKWRFEGNYTIKYTGINSSSVPTDENVYTGSASVKVAGVPTSGAGFNFVGWKLANGVIVLPGDTFEVTKEVIGEDNVVELEAVYSIYPKTAIRYDANGGEITITSDADLPSRASFVVENNVIKITNLNVNCKITAYDESVVTREGYEFLGWAKESAATEPDFVAGDIIAMDNEDPIDNILYAVWVRHYTITSSITADAEGNDNGSINPNGTTAVDEGESLTIEITPADGYTIKSILVDDEEQTTEGESRDEFVTDGYTFENIDKDHTIIVSFSADENGNNIPDDEEYREITYKDGVNGTVFEDVVFEKQLDGLATPLFGENPTRTDYVFVGWEPEVADVINGDATYTAQWKDDKNGNGIPDDEEDHYTVIFVAGDNGSLTGEVEFTEILIGLKFYDEVTVPTPVANEGYCFKNWEPTLPESDALVTSDLTYTANFSEDKNGNGIPDEDEYRTITYTDGVESEEVFADVVFDKALDGLETPEFTQDLDGIRPDYVFVGWDPEVADVVDGDATYTAQWEDDKNNNGVPDKDEYRTITYIDGVNGTVFEDVVFEKQLDGLETPEFTQDLDGIRLDYVFVGWDPEVADVVDGDATYTAQWKDDKNGNGIPDDEEDHYTVTFVAGDNGSLTGDIEFTEILTGLKFYDEVTVPTPVANEGYCFKNWEPALPESDALVTSDLTYTANFSEDKNGNGIPDEEEYRTITYTDGVESEEVFADVVFDKALDGLETPEFTQDLDGIRLDYVFVGWDPEVADVVDGDATYTAQWKDDKNGNGIPDDEEEHYTVTFVAGDNGSLTGEVEFTEILTGLKFYDEVTVPTPVANEGYCFKNWEPSLPEDDAVVTSDLTYTANFSEDKNGNGIPDEDEDTYTLTIDYVYSRGGEAAPSYSDEYLTGIEYSVASPEIQYYKADKAVVEGTMGEEDITEKVIYTPIHDENGNGIADEEEDFGEGGGDGEDIVIPEETPAPVEEIPYDGVNPSTGASLFDNIGLYIALIIGTMLVVIVETKKTIKR